MEISSNLSSRTDINHLPVFLEIAVFQHMGHIPFFPPMCTLTLIVSAAFHLSCRACRWQCRETEAYIHSNTAGVIDGLLRRGPWLVTYVYQANFTETDAIKPSQWSIGICNTLRKKRCLVHLDCSSLPAGMLLPRYCLCAAHISLNLA